MNEELEEDQCELVDSAIAKINLENEKDEQEEHNNSLTELVLVSRTKKMRSSSSYLGIYSFSLLVMSVVYFGFFKYI